MEIAIPLGQRPFEWHSWLQPRWFQLDDWFLVLGNLIRSFSAGGGRSSVEALTSISFDTVDRFFFWTRF